MPKISFILTAYNFGKYIKTAIQSLLDQNGAYSFEIIVVDDCSTDNTPEIVKTISDTRVKYFYNKKNLGVAGSINKAFSLTSGEYICRFDGDDEWYPWFLEETVPILDNNPEIGLVYGDISMINLNGEITEKEARVADYSQFGKKELLKKLCLDYIIPAPSIMGRRAAWESALPLDDDLIFCDFDLSINILSKWKLAYVPKPLSKYRVHDGNIHTTSFDKKRQGEQSIIKSINSFFAKTDILSEKDRREILGRGYFSFADSYFGLGNMKEARRCYKKGIKLMEKNAGPEYYRRYMATYIGTGIYDKVKGIYKKALGKEMQSA